MPNYGLCADCDKEVELTTNGCCSICQSESTMKRGAISELELAIENKRKKAIELMRAAWELVAFPDPEHPYGDIVQKADRLIKALEDYKNV